MAKPGKPVSQTRFSDTQFKLYKIFTTGKPKEPESQLAIAGV